MNIEYILDLNIYIISARSIYTHIIASPLFVYYTVIEQFFIISEFPRFLTPLDFWFNMNYNITGSISNCMQIFSSLQSPQRVLYQARGAKWEFLSLLGGKMGITRVFGVSVLSMSKRLMNEEKCEYKICVYSKL